MLSLPEANPDAYLTSSTPPTYIPEIVLEPLPSIITKHPDESTPLTSADIQVFLKIFPKVKAFEEEWILLENKDLPRKQLKPRAELLTQFTAEEKNMLEDMTSPCQQAWKHIQKLNQNQSLEEIISQNGFISGSAWAITCDKTFKAYRAATLDIPSSKAVLEIKSSLKDLEHQRTKENTSLTEQNYQMIKALHSLYDAPAFDVESMRPFTLRFDKVIGDMAHFLGVPIYGLFSKQQKEMQENELD